MRAVIQCRTYGAALSYSFDPIPAQTSILHLISNNSSHTPTIIHLFKHLVSQSCIPDKHGFTCGVIRSYNFVHMSYICFLSLSGHPSSSFMVPNFPALHLSSLITFPTTSMSHVLTPHAAIPMPVGTGLMKNTGFENDPNEQDF